MKVREAQHHATCRHRYALYTEQQHTNNLQSDIGKVVIGSNEHKAAYDTAFEHLNKYINKLLFI